MTRSSFGNDFQFRREPAHAELFLQQRIDAVQRAARPTAGDDQAVAVHAQHEPVGAEFGEINFRAQLRQVGVVAQQDFTSGRLFRVGHDGEFCAAQLFQIALQFLGGIALSGNRAGRDDDAVLALGFVGKGYVGLSAEDAPQKDAAQGQPC